MVALREGTAGNNVSCGFQRHPRRRRDRLRVRSESSRPLCPLQVVVGLLQLSDVLLEVVSGRRGLGQVALQRRDLPEGFCVLDVVLLL